MRVGLVNPPQPYLVIPSQYEPLGLEYVAGAVSSRSKHTAEVLDLAVYDESIAAGAIYSHGYDIVGFTATSLDIALVERVALRLRTMYDTAGEHIRLVIGGPHVSCVRGNMNFDLWDAAFVGEAETSFVEYLENPTVGVHTGYREQNLSQLPQPVRKPSYDITSCMGSRGCRVRCAFCAAGTIWPGCVHRVAPAALVDEVIRSCCIMGTDKVALFDEDLLSDSEWLDSFCELMHGKGITWRAQGRVDRVSPGKLDAMRRAGCVQLDFGIESFDDAVLKTLNKRTSATQNMQALMMTRDADITPRAYMMIGTPGHNEHTVDFNIDALAAMSGHDISVNMYTYMPLPGTPVHDKPEAYGVTILSHDLEKYNRHQYRRDEHGVVISTAWSPIDVSGMTHDELIADIDRMHHYVNSTANVNRGVDGYINKA